MGNIEEWKKWKKKNGRQETRDRREDNEAEQECHGFSDQGAARKAGEKKHLVIKDSTDVVRLSFTQMCLFTFKMNRLKIISVIHLLVTGENGTPACLAPSRDNTSVRSLAQLLQTYGD